MTIGAEIYNMNHTDFYSKIHFFMHMCVKFPFPQDNTNCASPKYMCVPSRGEFRPRQNRQLPRAVDLKGQLLSCQSF